MGLNNKVLYGIIAIAFVGGLFTAAYGGPILPTITFSGNVVATDDLTVDTNTLVVDSINNRVGVRTSSPDSALHVKGAVESEQPPNFNADNFVMKRTGPPSPDNIRYVLSHRNNNQDMWIYGYDGSQFKNFMKLDYPDNTLSFPVDGSSMTINNDLKRVGIGTDSPTSSLHVVGDFTLQSEIICTDCIDSDDIADGTISLADLADLGFPNIYQKRESYSIPVDGQISFASESCDPGDILLNGGFSTSGGSNRLEVYRSYQFPVDNEDNVEVTNQWVVGARDINSDGGGLVVFVTCLNTNP